MRIRLLQIKSFRGAACDKQAVFEEQAIANKKLSEGQIAEVKALLENATAQLESIKTDLSEKVHSRT